MLLSVEFQVAPTLWFIKEQVWTVLGKWMGKFNASTSVKENLNNIHWSLCFWKEIWYLKLDADFHEPLWNSLAAAVALPPCVSRLKYEHLQGCCSVRRCGVCMCFCACIHMCMCTQWERVVGQTVAASDWESL